LAFSITQIAAQVRRLTEDSLPIISSEAIFRPKHYEEISMAMPVTTTFTIEGYRITQYLGIVRGLIVRSPTISQGIMGGLKSIIGGRVGAYTEMCEQTRQQAYDLLIDHARALGANAVVGLRYDASEIGGKAAAATEVLCYGTAVVIAMES
jgi:uncharacterized protein YbjQ (UPF0145 family)